MNKIIGMLGFARRAGKMAFGYDSVVSTLKRGKYYDALVLIAEDASAKTIKNCKFECDKYDCPFVVTGTKIEYGSLLNKKEVSVLIILDENMIEYIRKNIITEDTEWEYMN